MNTQWRKPIGAFLLALAMLVCWSVAAVAETVTSRPEGDIYPLATCPVTGAKLGEMGPPVVKVYDGREVRFCCNGCPSKFEADKDKYWKQIDAAIVEQQKPLYPLDTCVVSGKKLGEMGPPVDYVYKNRLIRFCCKGCIDTFKKDPAKYIAILDQAVVDAQKPTYPVDTCIVQGNVLDDNAVNYVSGNRLYRFCCGGCVKSFEENPQKYMKELEKK